MGNMLPSFLYQAPHVASTVAAVVPSAAEDTMALRAKKLMAKPVLASKIEMHSAEFYQACTIGGILSCGLTHLAVTPLDVVKCNMLTDPSKYPSIASGFGITVKEQGLSGLVRGWAPTLIGYSFQGACKFGLYEFFKKNYADIALCPWEAVKVNVQTRPGFANGLMDGMPKVIAEGGVGGLYKGLTPLWMRQIPYTMMKFGAFERVVEAIYANAMPKPKAECSKNEQLGVSFAAGYIAGVFCTIVSPPADNLVSKLNSKPGSTSGEIIAEMGWYNLFTRGLPLRIVMIGTLTGLQWGIYDAYKVYVGLPTSGGGGEKKPTSGGGGEEKK